MKILVISDLHYDNRVFRGVDESKAWEWLLSIVDYHKPDLLLSCGDWGLAVNLDEFYELLNKVIVLTIYGNHENMYVLEPLYNVRSHEYLPVLMRDGEIYRFGDLKISGINGIISVKKKVRKGVPRKTPQEFMEIAEKLKGKGIDILLIHETPFLPELFPFMRNTIASRTVLKAIEIVKPRIVVNGHMHSGGYKIYDFSFGCRYVYIDSSQAQRYYLIFRLNNSIIIEIWRDFSIITSIKA